MKTRGAVLFLAMAGLITLNAKDPTKDQLLQRITSLHTRIYSLDNVLLKPFAPTPDEPALDDEGDWRGMMTAIGEFVQKQGRSDELDSLLPALGAASETMIQTRKTTFKLLIKPALKQEKDQKNGISRLDPAKFDFSKLKADKVIENNTQLVKEKEALLEMAKQFPALKTAFAGKKAKLEALEVLERIELTLELTIGKFERDAVKLDAAAKAASST